MDLGKNAGSNFFNTKHHPIKEHENVIVFCKRTLTYHPIMQKRKGGGENRYKYKYTPSNTGKREVLNGFVMKDAIHNGNNRFRFPSSIQRFNRQRGLHPTQKPVKLFEYLIKTYTNENDLVLDNCAGSGTTGIAARNLNRNFILIEKELEYVELIEKRLSEPYQKRLINE